MYRIYIVEDDATIASLVAENLRRWGFEAVCAQDFSAVDREFGELSPDLVLMDISLPFFNGYYWCDRLRRVSRAPIVFLSSHAENMDIVMAVNMGGDDYITKPFSVEVLIAKVNAVLRRAYSYAGEKPELSARGVKLCAADGTVCCGEKTAELTKNEQRILRALLERKNSIVTREEIMRELWESESFVDDNTLTVNINRLRRKLEDLGAPDLISTKKGQGYMIHD